MIKTVTIASALMATIATGASAQSIKSWNDPYVAATPPTPLFGTHTPVRNCDSMTSLPLENTVITEATETPATETEPALCNITAVVKRYEEDDPITVWVNLPVYNWNGRFMGIGGGGYSGGTRAYALHQNLSGFASATTDAGPRTVQPGRKVKNGEFGLDEYGKLDWRAIRNFGHRGVHVMSVIGKAITAAYYGKPANYAYFNGCSTGGRQAMTEAQMYPEDYDGILAAAPGINAAKYVAGRIWGQLHMELSGNFVPKCKLDAVTAAAVTSCDMIDGVKDGIIGNPRLCSYSPATFVGQNVAGCGTFTAADADIVQKAWEGPSKRDGSRKWAGFAIGTPLETLQSTEKNPETGEWQTSSAWNGYFLSWHRYFLSQDPTLQIGEMSRNQFEEYWDQSDEMYQHIYSAENANLDALSARNGKILIWHGETDHYIPAYGSINYYQRVAARLGSMSKANETIRLFLAPGVNHCGRGKGPTPTAMLDALMSWVENGKAPERLLSVTRDKETGKVTRSRPLCLYPKVARYKGSGSTDKAENFVCADSY